MNFITPGYEDLELSTQILIKEALNRGVNVEVLDRNDNFIRLIKGERVEYVKQATRTSADTYIAPLIMENKEVTKKILKENNINVPRGEMFYNREDALTIHNKYKGQDIVIKPVSTNFGKGISILKDNRDEKKFIEAVNEAFKFDNSIIIEEFIHGKEYRFLIINNSVIAVLHRVSANVTGDGTKKIKELIEEKNKSPLRGEAYKKPLEKIKTGAAEISFLEVQGKDLNYVPDDGEQVFLRKNSNISTGGDSIDYTDEVLGRYKDIAVKAADAVGAKICGADIIIKDIHENPHPEDSREAGYSVIELNFNPAIHIHGFPLRGKNRNAERKILDLLGFTRENDA